ncbi:hypothetical protein K5X82_02405 [Halosquirtibacter xylanolyticus]|uniref:carcinine hydrolase/isopenicillin-N N-acyltransferase family protein n=1 Tax=Halosquirtibacter xylanolyticus TaxID=3374599 RepID=UPI003748120B|nr:hypothetical protein K5X82_02405 [Prolixibacteraceae bacterium]
MRNRTTILLLITMVCLTSIQSLACTTAVVSGKYTKNGRPLLWKVRDTQSHYNKIQIFEDGKYKYVALTNAIKDDSTMVWGGYNEYGFAIMNNASFNTNLDNPTDFCDQEGIVMKKALQTCKSLKDFERMLKKLPKPMGLNANFGVIDAQGGAAYYETDNNQFVKFDANDPRTAPNGYLVRTNYSFIGKKDVGYGFIRFETATELFFQMDSRDQINATHIATKTSRSLYQSLLKIDYDNYRDFSASPFVNNGDLICRHETASAITIEGAKSIETASQTTMWSTIAFPLSTPAIPIRLTKDNTLPKCMVAPKGKKPTLSILGMEWKKLIYPIKRSSGYKYMNLKAYVCKDSGIKSKIDHMQEMINQHIPQTDSENEWKTFYQWVDRNIPKQFK